MATGTSDAGADQSTDPELVNAGDFIDRFELAHRLDVHERTVRHMVSRGELPKPCLSAGGRPRWPWTHVVGYCRKRHLRQEEPVSTEAFEGNTSDPRTFGAQVKKAAERFGCEQVTFVGDRGMIKCGQIQILTEAGFHYITAITKPQITKLLNDGVLQMELFDATVCEVQDGGTVT